MPMFPTPKLSPTLEHTYQRLLKIRRNKGIGITSNPYLKTTFTGFDGIERPLSLRYYQLQGILHLCLMTKFVLGDDTGLGKCKNLQSLITTDRGMVQLGSFAPTESPCTPNTSYPLKEPISVWTGWEWAPVKSYYYNGQKPIVKIRTRRGFETTGTLVHPLWIRNALGENFGKMGDLQLGDYVCLERNSQEVAFPDKEPILPIPDPGAFSSSAVIYNVPEFLTPDLASLLAYVIAEGWTNSHKSMQITQHRSHNPETHDHIRNLCYTLFGLEENTSKINFDVTISINSVYIREYFIRLGVDLGLSAGKHVPWPIFQGTGESVRAFLRAYFDSEGSVGAGEFIEVSSASEQLLKEVQLLLLRLGILSTRSPKKVKGYNHVYWRLVICGEDACRFCERIGFLTPRKQIAAESFLLKKHNTNLDIIPHAKKLVNQFRQDLLIKTTLSGSNACRKGSGIKQFGISFEKSLNNIRNYGCNPSYQCLENMLNVANRVGLQTSAVQEISEILCNRFFYDPIVSIEYGTEEVADLEIDHPRHSFVADGMINHNTITSIASLCYIWNQEPKTKVFVLTNKSATTQWAKEFSKFTTGIQVLLCKGTAEQRARVLAQFQEDPQQPTVMIMGYRSAVRDFSNLLDLKDCILILDEVTAVKNTKTRVHKVVAHIASQSARVWGLSATIIKNNLLEGHAIYTLVVPGLFGTKNNFLDTYCIVKMQPIGKGRKVPVLVGYREGAISAFRKMIDAYFLGRPKHEVASELPVLSIKEIEVGLSPEQEHWFEKAQEDLMTIRGEEKEVTILTRIIYMQQIVNHLGLIDEVGGSEKIDTLIELLTEGEFSDEKVIVYTRFKKMVDILIPLLQQNGIQAVRITGAENEDQRQAAQNAFQDPNSDVRVVCLTDAGSEAINLQAAKALIFIDSPWSAGNFLQILGRMIRIGSVHDRVYAIHLIARGRGKTKFIDERVIEVLKSKLAVIEAVLGKRLKGETEKDAVIPVENDITALFRALQSDAAQARGVPLPAPKQEPTVSVVAPVPTATNEPVGDFDFSLLKR